MPKKKTTKSAAKKSIKKAASKSSVEKDVANETSAPKSNEASIKTKQALAKKDTESTDKKSSPIAFSLDDVAAIVASKKKQSKEETPVVKAPVKAVTPAAKKKVIVTNDTPTEKRVHAAASLADILGFNPAQKRPAASLEEDQIPSKWKKYYKLLKGLQTHVRNEIDLHTADTLKHSSRDDSGSGASYGNHQADAGTDEFDRDFALSLVSNEQEALHEIQEAIGRIKDGSYGICEVTGNPINKERLEAVPFARFSVEGQSEYEKNKRRRIDRNVGGLFADNSDAPKITSDDDDE